MSLKDEADNDDTVRQRSNTLSSTVDGGLKADDLKKLNAAASRPSAPESPRESLLSANFRRSQQQNKSGTTSNNDDATSYKSGTTSFRGTADETDYTAHTDEPELKDFLSKWTSEKLAALQSAVKLAPWHDVSHNIQTVSTAMTAEEIARWLRESNFARTIDESRTIGNAMLRRRMFFQFNKKSTKPGFWPEEDIIKYTLDDRMAKGNSVFSKLSRIATSKKTDWGPPVKYKALGTFVFAVIEERERRSEADSSFNTVEDSYGSIHLKESDGLNFSAQKEDVPVPSVGSATPDECAWADEWEIVISENTDGYGWRYHVSDFQEIAKFIKGDGSNKNFTVRLREWQRPAAKRHDSSATSRRFVQGFSSAVTDEEKTADEVEEEKKKEMLAKAAQFIARVPRKGTLDLQVLQGVDLLKMCDSYVIVENREFSLKSDACPKVQRHQWGFRLDVPIANDMEPTRITVFQDKKLARSNVNLGTCELFIPQLQLEVTQSIPLKLLDNERSSDLIAQADALGTISVTWKFTPDETAAPAAGATPKAQVSGAKRCVLSMHIVKGEGLTKERKRIGPCNMPVGGKSKCFFRLLYLGEYCDMFAQSPLFTFQPVIEFNWCTSIPLVVSSPVELQFWIADLPTPVGIINLVYDQQQQQLLNLESATQTGLQAESWNPCIFQGVPGYQGTIEIKPIVVDGISSAAVATSLGKLTLNLVWVPELDTLEQLVSMGVADVVDTSSTRKVKNLLDAWEEPVALGKKAAAAAATAAESARPTALAASKQSATAGITSRDIIQKK